MIKDVVVNLSLKEGEGRARDYAISVASQFGAHVAGVAFTYEAVVVGSVFDGVVLQLIETQRAESRKRAQKAAAEFDEQARKDGIHVATRVINTTIDGVGGTFAGIARRFDLSVVAQPNPNEPGVERLILESALFGSGRPVIVVPYIHKSPMKLDRVLVCWDGGRCAARALGDAMPFLQRAKAIEVMTISGEAGKPSDVSGADIAEHLARHSRKVELKNIVSPDIDVANTILSHAADCSADLVVMGGYGHSRLRELVLGGATRTMVNSMTVPVLMSH